MADCGQSDVPTTEGTSIRRPIDVLFVCDEWKSSNGGLSAFNREFVVNLAKISRGKIKVHCYVSDKSDEAADKEDARKNGVNLLIAQKIPGTANPHDWLKFPPPELPNIDVVIGHGRKFGVPAYCIMKNMANCKLVQFLHVFCPDLGKYKSSKSSAEGDTIHENEEKHKLELELCEAADAVVTVGPRLQQKYRRCLPDIKVEAFTPGIIDSYLVHQRPRWQLHSDEVFSCSVCGRASFEDRLLKGYDIIANAIGSLGENFKMVFVGSPPEKQRKLENWFLTETKITREQLTIHSYVDRQQLKRKFRESDFVALPSRTEGFGLVALEAISADMPILISRQAGISEALQKVEGGNSVIVESNDPEEWVNRINQLAKQDPQERHDKAVCLRKNYEKTYSWKNQCTKFLSLTENLLMEADKENINQQSQESTRSDQSSFPGSLKRPRTDADDKLQNSIAAVLQATLSLQKDPATGNELLVLKNGGFKLDQGQEENEALQSRAVRCDKGFARFRPRQMKEPHSLIALTVKHKILSIWRTLCMFLFSLILLCFCLDCEETLSKQCLQPHLVSKPKPLFDYHLVSKLKTLFDITNQIESINQVYFSEWPHDVIICLYSLFFFMTLLSFYSVSYDGNEE